MPTDDAKSLLVEVVTKPKKPPLPVQHDSPWGNPPIGPKDVWNFVHAQPGWTDVKLEDVIFHCPPFEEILPDQLSFPKVLGMIRDKILILYGPARYAEDLEDHKRQAIDAGARLVAIVCKPHVPIFENAA